MMWLMLSESDSEAGEVEETEDKKSITIIKSEKGEDRRAFTCTRSRVHVSACVGS